MVLEETLTGLERGRAQLDFRVVCHPDLKPTSHDVGFRFAVVDADVLLDGFFQFFFYFRLRFSEDIFDDGLSGFRIVTDSVSSLPAAVLSFADVLLLLQRCDFWTVKKPFPLTTAAQNIHVFLPKLPLHKKALFRVVESGKLLNRLRNGHLEKSAVTGD